MDAKSMDNQIRRSGTSPDLWARLEAPATASPGLRTTPRGVGKALLVAFRGCTQLPMSPGRRFQSCLEGSSSMGENPCRVISVGSKSSDKNKNHLSANLDHIFRIWEHPIITLLLFQQCLFCHRLASPLRAADGGAGRAQLSRGSDKELQVAISSLGA